LVHVERVGVKYVRGGRRREAEGREEFDAEAGYRLLRVRTV